MILRARLAAAAPGLPAVRLAGSAEFCDALHRQRLDLPVWDGELYLELHRGTYTTHGWLKRANRRAEQQLRIAECLQVGGPTPMQDAASLDETWKLLLLNQFHDILPGSSITAVYDDARAHHAEIAKRAEAAIDDALRHWSAAAGTEGLESPMLVVNPSSVPRSGVVECEGSLHQVNDVPALGMAVVDRAARTSGSVEVTERTLDNGVLRVSLDDAGRIIELRRYADGVHVGMGPMNQLVVYEDRPRQWEAWDIDAEYVEKGRPLDGPAEIRLALDDPLRGVIEVSRDGITQQYVLDAGSPRLDIRTRICWSEDHRLLRALFPVSVRASHATYEIQYGHVERSVHRNTSWEKARFEVCAHRWMNLQEPGLGVALLNDGRYGHSCDGNVMGLSLLRGARTPDPTADVGEHEFTYSLMPHGGDWRAAGVDHEAEALNAPWLCRPLPAGQAGLDRWSPIRIETEGAIGVEVSALKPAEDDDRIVLRLVETRGGRGRVTVHWNFDVGRVDETDLLEQEHGAWFNESPSTIDLSPFEIVTLATRRDG
jgi:alpha-mannosidase